MSYFLFNGVSSEDLGLIVTKPILRPSWEELAEVVEIPGRAAKMVKYAGTYSDSDMTIHTAICDASPEKLRAIYSTLRGSGKLQLSTAPDEYLNVRLSALTPEPVALLMGELPLNFTVSPFAYAVLPTTADLTAATEYVAVENPGSAYSEPLFTITGKGDISFIVNGAEFRLSLPDSLSGTAIYIDSAVSVAYTESGSVKQSVTQHTTGSFPLLHTGTNYIKHSGYVTSAAVNVRERWY